MYHDLDSGCLQWILHRVSVLYGLGLHEDHPTKMLTIPAIDGNKRPRNKSSLYFIVKTKTIVSSFT